MVHHPGSAVGKKTGLITEAVSEERLAEADYYARKCGIPLEDALRIIESAYGSKPSKSKPPKHGKRGRR